MADNSLKEPHKHRLLQPAIYLITAMLLCGCQPNPTTNPDSQSSSGLRLTSILGEPQNADFARAEQPRDFVFPDDHGPHDRYRSEWWYLTAALKDSEGNEYGVHYTLFRQALYPNITGAGPWHTGQAYLGHLAITDVSAGEHFEAERFARGHPEIAGVSVSPRQSTVNSDPSTVPSGPSQFQATIENWVLSGDVSDRLDLTLSAAASMIEKPFGVKLRLQQTAPIVLQGHRGLSEKGPGSASYYYSMPRLAISGTLRLDEKDIQVEGLGWLDREWSTSVLGKALAGWDWFSLQLDDNRSIMAFRLRRNDGNRDEYDHGLLINHSILDDKPVVGQGDSGIRLLKANDFTLTPTRYFRDSQGIDWPVSWTFSTKEETFTINALLDQQTVDLSIRYWEGLVEVRDDNHHRIGSGYMELTGYGPTLN